jgi:ABC-type cobalt transport system substrate-binding protein
MKRIIIIILLLLSVNIAQDTLWTKTFGGSNDDYGRSVQQTTDGGYVIGGYTSSYGNGSADVWLIKTDADGDTLWTQTYGGSNGDAGYSVQQTTDGGYVIGGYTSSYGNGSGDVWLIKTDSNGDSLWTKTFGGSDGDYGIQCNKPQMVDI